MKRTLCILGAIFAALLWVNASTYADDATSQPTSKPAGDTLSVDELIGHVVKATGKPEAIAKGLKNRVSHSELVLAAMGIRAKVTSYHSIPSGKKADEGLLAVTIEIPGMGSQQIGLKDGIAWSVDPTMGPRLLQGAEAAVVKRELFSDPASRLQAPAKKKVVGKTNFGGVECWKLEIALPESKTPEHWYVDATSHLVLGMESETETMMGKIKQKVTFSDYRDVDGVKIPFVAKVESPMQQFTTTISKIEHVAIPAEKFDFPPVIQKLVDKKREQEKAKEGAKGGAEEGKEGTTSAPKGS